MSSFDRRTLLIFAALAGCGFTPVYGPNGSAGGLRGTIAADPPRDPSGFAFVRHIEDRLGLPENAEYQLSAEIFTDLAGLGVTPNQVITRYQLRGRARFVLREIGSDRVVTSGEVSNFASYSATGTPFATQAAERDARERLMVILADEVVARLLATAGEWR